VSTYFTRIEFPGEAAVTVQPLVLPASVQVIDRRPLPLARAAKIARAWGGLKEPQFLPAGFLLRGFYRHRFGDHVGLVAVYGRPGEKETLSVFQVPRLGMGPMSQRHGPSLRVVSGQRGEADVTVVGSLPEEELRRVMDSIPQ